MPLDDQNPITPLQSETIRACLKTLASSVVGLIALYTGKAFDLEFINKTIDLAMPVIIMLPIIYYQIKAIRARIAATQTIITKEPENEPQIPPERVP